jgi:hypothetical protein
LECPDGSHIVKSAKGEYCMGLNGKKNGPYVYRHENGRKASEGYYSEGKLHGPRRVWNTNGTMIINGNYQDGVAVGTWTHWHDNGRKKIEIEYRNGRAVSSRPDSPDGTWPCRFCWDEETGEVVRCYEFSL